MKNTPPSANNATAIRVTNGLRLAFVGTAYGFYQRNSITWRLGIGLVAVISISTLVLFVLHPESRLAEIDRQQAMQGNPVAENDLGVMYETGDGVPKSYTKAAKWYRLAAQAGDVHAQVNLGWLYQKGRGNNEKHPAQCQ